MNGRSAPPIRRLWLAAALGLLLCGCGLADYSPWPSSSGGGRPAPVRRARAVSQAPAVATAQAYRAEAGPSAFTPLRAAEADALARQLSPASQSLDSFAVLAPSLRLSLEHLARQPQSALALVQPGGSLSWGQLRRSAEELQSLLPRLDGEPGLLAERFVWYELAPRPVVTGYYSPELPASLTRQPGFEHPLYAPPPDLASRPGAFDRRAVDAGALEGRGLELAWLSNPADVFLLQTEGGGVLRLPDGSLRGVHFAAGNGLPFKGLGRILQEAGVLSKEGLTREGMRAWCAANPARARELMAENRSYVFFRFTAAASEGSLGKPLTPLVSLATDASLLPLGAVAALDVPLPGRDGPTRLRGLALAQDSGADIRGSRLDLYLGAGPEAERLEAGLRTPGSLHLLVSKAALRAGP